MTCVCVVIGQMYLGCSSVTGAAQSHLQSSRFVCIVFEHRAITTLALRAFEINLHHEHRFSPQRG